MKLFLAHCDAFAESAWLGSPDNGYSLIYRVSKSQTIIFDSETFYEAIRGLCQQFPLYGTLKRIKHEKSYTGFFLHLLPQFVVIGHFIVFTLLFLKAFLGLESRFSSVHFVTLETLKAALKVAFLCCFSWHILWNPNLHVKG